MCKYLIKQCDSYCEYVGSKLDVLRDVCYRRLVRVNSLKQNDCFFWYEFIQKSPLRRYYFMFLQAILYLTLISSVLAFYVFPYYIVENEEWMFFIGLGGCVLFLSLALGVFCLKLYSYEKIYNRYVSILGHSINSGKNEIGLDINSVIYSIRKLERQTRKCDRKVDKLFDQYYKVANLSDENQIKCKLDSILETISTIETLLRNSYKEIEILEQDLIKLTIQSKNNETQNK